MPLAIGAVLVSSPANPCCCPGGDCCLYPWPDPNGEAGGPYYPSTDLPATVVLLGITLTLGADPSAPYDYREAGNPSSNNFVNASLDGTSPVWIRSTQDPPFPSPATSACLIDGTVVEDEFPDTLSMLFSGYSTTVYRVSQCLWEGEDVCGNIWSVWYGDVGGEGGVDYKWSADAWQFDFGSGIDCPMSEAFPFSTKSDPQDTPIGTYDVGIVTIVVS